MEKVSGSKPAIKAKQETRKVAVQDPSDSDSSECSCDSCLEIMAEAYNEYLQEIGSAPTGYRTSLEGSGSSKENNHKISNRCLPNGKRPMTGLNLSNSRGAQSAMDLDCSSSHTAEQPYTEEEIRQMIERVNQRIQQNLQKHKELAEDKKQQKRQLMCKVKEELEKLRYRCRIELERARKMPIDPNKLKAWNYQPLVKEKRNKQGVPEEPSKPQCFEGRHRQKKKAQTNTGKVNYELLGQNRFLEDLRRRVKQEYSKKRHHGKKHAGCTFDECDRHHLKTPAEDIEKIKRSIDKRAEQFLKKQKQQRQDEQNLEKVKQAKLRGIALEAKRKLDKCRKQTIDEERSTFNLSLQEFSTFSHMRDANDIKKRELLLKKLQEQAENIDMRETPRNNQNAQQHHVEDEPFEKVATKQPQQRTGDKKNQSKKPQPQNIRQQSVKQMKQSLAEQKPTRKVVNGLPPTDINEPTNQFYKWEMPIQEEQMKTIFEEAKLVRPPAPKVKKGEQVQSKGSPMAASPTKQAQQHPQQAHHGKGQSRVEKKQFREEKLTHKKEQLTKQYGRRTETVQERVVHDKPVGAVPTPKSEQRGTRRKSNGEIKQRFLEKLKQKEQDQAHVPQVADYSGNRTHPSNHHYDTYNAVGDSDRLAGEKLAVHDPIAQQHQLHTRAHDPSHLLLDNDFLSEQDKKVFILNYRLLSKVERLLI